MADLKALESEINALTPPQKLRLAAELLELGKAALAHSIADRVVTELGAAIALAKLGKG